MIKQHHLQVYLQHLQQHLPELTQVQLQDILQGVEIRLLPAKQAWFVAGDIVTQMAFVVQGLCKLCYSTTEGELININFMQQGDVAGDYQAFLQGIPCKYSLYAIEESILLFISKDDLQHYTQQYPVFYRYLNQRMTQLLFRYIERTEQFLITDAQSRYVHFMHHQPELFQRLSVSDLCSYLGITRQSLTRIRKHLSQQYGD